MNGSIPIVVDRNLKQSFGTGISSVAPAHNLEALKMSYVYGLDRKGCVDPQTGCLTQPATLEGTSIYMEPDELVDTIRNRLEEEGQFFGTFMQQGITYQAKGEGERIYLMTVDSWFLNIPDPVKF